MDTAASRRRTLLIASVVFGVACVAFSAWELIAQEGQPALVRPESWLPRRATALVLGAVSLVTTWKWFRAKPREKSFITTRDLRGR